jgi:NADH dehydrogenase [ubiquinone] 1 alpha subcomplex assembly factor 7
MPTPVRTAILEAIRDHGPISFAEYMELALYGEGGFYEEPPVGADGDFVTSPHVHPVFGELLGRAIGELRVALGDPAPFRIVEVGAGDGTLAAQLLDAVGADGLDYAAVERGRGAREALERIEGVSVSETLAGRSGPEGPHLILAHELLDNLPFRRVRGTPEGPREVRVGSIGGRLVEVLVDPEPGEDLARAGEGVDPNEEVVVPDGALAFIDEVAAALTRGYALLIDYGDVGSSGGEAHGYRGHRVVDDPLDLPGETDITAGIDFATIARRAEAGGLTVFPVVTQHRALMALGFEAWVRGELARQVELLDERDGLGAVRTWTGRSRATLLADPASLGRFKWLLLATTELPAPTWLEDAASGAPGGTG